MSPCHQSLIDDVVKIHPDNTVTEALEIFKKANIRSLPVVNDEGLFVGLFGLRHLLLSLLPASVRMEDGLERLDFLVGATPAIAKRFRKNMEIKVSELMDKEPEVVHQDTATWEVLRIMALRGSPVSVVDENSKKFIGLISRQSLLADIENLVEEMDKEAKEETK